MCQFDVSEIVQKSENLVAIPMNSMWSESIDRV